MKESQNIEYKEVWKDEYLKWIAGFANASGGKLYIGINDAGEVIGAKNANKLLEDIPNKIVSILGIIPEVHLWEKENKKYIEIIINPSSVPISYKGAYFMRSGSTKQELRGSALHHFLIRRTGKSWDNLPCEGATIEDVAESAVNYFIQKATASNRITHNADKENILEMADKVMDILKTKYLISPISYKGLQRIETLELPEDALREAIFNAIVYKDYTGAPIQLSVYNDKLILWNEGRLPDGFTVQTLLDKHPSRPYNKTIAEIFLKQDLLKPGAGASLK